jgi:hypothetical protein
MLLFNKSSLVSLIFALNLSTGVVRADFNSLLNEIGGVINGAIGQQQPQKQAQPQQPQQPQQQSQKQEPVRKLALSDGPETPTGNDDFEKLFGDNPFCVISGLCSSSTSSKVPEPTTSAATTPASTTSKQDVSTTQPTTTTSKQVVPTPQSTSSYGPTSTSGATSAKPTTITPTSTSSSTNPEPTNTTPSNTDWGSIALLFFNLFKNLVETILKSFNKS